ncbi:type II toxin-antitoxin system PemK/MazF family toxin [Promicromonospora sp. NPDC090134]|uniref:type II toxin-antitoxin system PemK/MazF family toxin n=1 Tax=Promicromonospora sp. NPDC090134 TaxID=3364408 RepID=UPI003809CC92
MRRPGLVIVSNDAYNAAARRLGRGVLTVVPLTSNVKRVLSFQVLVSKRGSGLAVDSKAQAEQVRAVDMGRLVNRVRKLSTEEESALDDALRVHLGIS